MNIRKESEISGEDVPVSLIASLSGRDISLDTAKEFILSVDGVAGLGYTFRLIVQQASKYLVHDKVLQNLSGHTSLRFSYTLKALR